MAISQNFDKANKTKFAREQLTTEVRNLKILETQYKNYRDIFFRIAILDYRLGNLTEARTYIKKSLEVDPNFNEGLAFGKKVGI